MRYGMKLCLVAGLVVLGVAGCATQAQDPAMPETRAQAVVNDFPTQARVEYVFECMEQHGGQNYDNLYHCSCMMDEIAKRLPYQEYSEAVVFTKLRSTPGEAGGVFRDPPQAKRLREKLQAAESEAESICFIN